LNPKISCTWLVPNRAASKCRLPSQPTTAINKWAKRLLHSPLEFADPTGCPAVLWQRLCQFLPLLPRQPLPRSAGLQRQLLLLASKLPAARAAARAAAATAEARAEWPTIQIAQNALDIRVMRVINGCEHIASVHKELKDVLQFCFRCRRELGTECTEIHTLRFSLTLSPQKT